MNKNRWSLRLHTTVQAFGPSHPTPLSSTEQEYDRVICLHSQGMESSEAVRHFQYSRYESWNLVQLQGFKEKTEIDKLMQRYTSLIKQIRTLKLRKLTLWMFNFWTSFIPILGLTQHL